MVKYFIKKRGLAEVVSTLCLHARDNIQVGDLGTGVSMSAFTNNVQYITETKDESATTQ